MILRNAPRLAKRLGNQLGAAHRVLVPLRHAHRTVDPDAPRRPDPDLAHLLADGAGLAHLRQKPLPIFRTPHRRAAASPTPDRRHKRPDLQAIARNMVRHPPHLARIRINREVRSGHEKVDPVEFLPIRPRIRRQPQQSIQSDDRLAIRSTLADNPRPGGVLKLGISVEMFSHLALPGDLAARLWFGTARPLVKPFVPQYPSAWRAIRACSPPPVACRGAHLKTSSLPQQPAATGRISRPPRPAPSQAQSAGPKPNPSRNPQARDKARATTRRGRPPPKPSSL